MIKPVLQDRALWDDVYSAAINQSSTLHIWWLGQSGFLMQHKGTRVLADPYLSDALTKKYAATDKPHLRMSERVVDPVFLREISVVTASHAHTDHLDGETLHALRKHHLDTQSGWVPRFVAPRAIAKLAAERWGDEPDELLDAGESYGSDDFRITAIPSAHETVDRTPRDECLYLGYVFQFEDFTIYHSGDTVLYEGLVDRLRRFTIDVALLPINGRAPERRVAGNLWGREAAWLAKEIGAGVVIPCHYDMFEFNTATPDEFVAECERLGQRYRVLKLGERWSSTELER